MKRKTLLGMLPLLICLSAGAADPPRYKLSVGQELTYDITGTSWSTSDASGPQNKQVETSSRRFWVAAANPDGGWHIVTETVEKPGSGDRPRLECFDLLPDGQIHMDTMAQMMLDPSGILPRLPSDASATTWQGVGRDNDVTTFHSAPKTEPSFINFDGTVDGVFPHLYQWDITEHYGFDTARGLPVQSSAHYDEKLYHRVEENATVLTEDKLLSPDDIKQFAAQAQTAISARSDYEKAMDTAATPGSAATTDAALAIVATARKQVTLPELTSVLDATIAGHPEYVKEMTQDQQNQAAVIGKPAPDWEFADLAGQRHSLKELRGKVVVLDFWYRGCGWCMRAMPQVKQLSADYAGKPVAIFGVNTDKDPKDAQVVADYFSLPYPTLLTGSPDQAGQSPISDQYHVHVFPTMILIDPDGIIRDFHVGYSPTLHDDVAKKINTLLGPAA